MSPEFMLITITHKKTFVVIKKKVTCSPKEGLENAENTGKIHVHRQGPSQRVLESFLRPSEVPRTLRLLSVLFPQLSPLG